MSHEPSRPGDRSTPPDEHAQDATAREASSGDGAAFERAADLVISGALEALRTALARDPGLISRRSPRAHRSTLLHYVSANGYEDRRQVTPPNIVEVATLLLDAGADVNAPDAASRTPLHMAVERGDALIVTLLLARKADATSRDRTGWTPLHHAAAKDQMEIARLLLDAGVDPNALSELGGTPLHEAAAGASAAMVELLLAGGTDPTIRSTPGVTALDLAREFKNAAAIAILEKQQK
jgi:ankyrin repeat protein